MIVKDGQLTELEVWIQRIWDKAIGYGLNPYPTNFEIVPPHIMYEYGSYGIPGRFSHWTHGRSYQQMKTMYDYGLSKIYELVINTNPCQAFLMETNPPLHNKLVVAHVLAHCDFFRNNAYFAKTNRGMAETVALHAQRLDKYAFDYGKLKVEKFLDAVLSIEDHVDFGLFDNPDPVDDKKKKNRSTTAYDDLWDLDKPKKLEPLKISKTKIPAKPTPDLLGFLLQHAPYLEDWQRDVISMIRNERIYFEPQIRTKILNEGWASFWHTRILRDLDLPGDEYTQFATLHSSVVSPNRRSLNPYHVGMKLLEAIENRWDDPSNEDKERLGLTGNQGRAKIFEVREFESDVSLIRNYLTKEIVEDLDLFTYAYEKDEGWVVTEKNWERVRDNLVSQLSRYHPRIFVIDSDHENRGGLLLQHEFDGADLDLNYANLTLRYIYELWGRPVTLKTTHDSKPLTFMYNGTDVIKSFE